MSLDRLIIFGVAIVAVSLAMPYLAPGLLETQMAAIDKSANTDEGKKPGPVPGYTHQVVLSADRAGHYQADATINGISVHVMVDTGATIVALTGETARRLGIDTSRSTGHAVLSTANGAVMASIVNLDQVRIGNVSVSNVEAAVLPSGALDINLLGMSFLKKLARFQSAGDQLVLVQ